MLNGLLCQHFAHIGFAGRVTNHAGTAAEQRNRHMPCALHMRHHHNLHEMAHMQAICRGIEADIELDFLILHQIPDLFLIGHLRDHAARLEFVKYAHSKYLPKIFRAEGYKKRPLQSKITEGGKSAVPPLFTAFSQKRPHRVHSP